MLVPQKRSVIHSIKELMDSQHKTDDQHADKRLKMQCEVDMERIRSSGEVDMERIRSSEQIAQIQAEIQANAQVKQMEVFAHIMQQVVGVLCPPSSR